MAQSQRSTSTQKKSSPAKAKAKAAGKAAPAAAPKAKARPASERERAAAPEAGGRARTAYEPAHRDHAPAHAPLLDADARHDVAGVVVAIVGVAMLIAVLAPSTGLLTQAVSDGLHAVLGVGAFLVPAALVVWALSFFVHSWRVEPGRVAVGAALVVVAVMGIVGLCTPGCEENPSLLFNAYVLADHGGYVGNGVAWLLLALVGKVVGIVVLCGVAAAGLIVVGLNVREVVYDLLDRAAYSRAQARARSEERAATARRRSQMRERERARSAAYADRGPRDDYDYDYGYGCDDGGYAPTALFDPARPLSNRPYDEDPLDDGRGSFGRAPTERVPSGRRRGATVAVQAPAAPTVELPGDEFAGGYAAPRPPERTRPASGGAQDWGNVPASVLRTPEERAAWAAEVAASVPPEAYGAAGERAAAEPAAPDPAAVEEPRAAAATEPQGEEEGKARPAAGVDPVAACDPEPQPNGETAADEQAEAPAPAEPAAPSFLQRKREKRVRQASQWWDPADDWNREDWDESGLYDEPAPDGGAPVPGVLPGAPCSFDDALDGRADDGAAGPAAALTLVDGAPGAPDAAPAAPRPASGSFLHVVSEPAPAAPALSLAPEPEPRGAAPAFSLAPEPEPRDAEPDPDPREAPRPAPGFSAVAPARPAHAALPWEDADDEDADGGIASPAAATPLPQAAAAVRPSTAQPASPAAAFVLPDPAIFHRNAAGFARTDDQRREAAEMAERLQATLTEFGVRAEVVKWVEGPTCTTYMVSPGEGVRVSRFTALEDDIARALARTSVRIYAPVPNTSYVGIEVSSNNRQSVAFGDVLPYVNGGPLDLAIGLDANGEPVHSDLAKLPHLLIAGTTGSGKSVMMNTIIMSLLMRDTPDDVRLIMVDPKQVEFSVYAGIPHLVMPVVSDPRQAAAALQWAVTEMDRRYRLFSNMGVRDLASYNRLVQSDAFELSENPPRRLPSLVVIIDELADLMMVAKKDVEASIVRIAQLGRACGIHLVMATQTPRADIVTGLIRANVANRIALRVSKGVDSKIIIDQTGAEKLLPHGDMLFLEAGWSDKPRRIQGCYLSDDEIKRVVEHLRGQEPPGDLCNMAPLPGAKAAGSFDDASVSGGGKAGNDDDPLAWEAAKLVVDTQMGSTSLVQRRLKLGYARAGRVMDMLEEMGVVGPAKGSKPRDVLVRDLDELETLRGTFDDLDEEY